MSAHQHHHQQQHPSVYTIHESSLNGSQSQDGQMIIDNSMVPAQQAMAMTQQPTSMHQHQHHQHQQQQQQQQQLQQQQQQQQQQQHQHQQNVVSSQPIASGARVAPENGQNLVYNVHPMFNMLEEYDTMLIRQQVDYTSTCCGFENSNTYTVRSKGGVPLLKAVETSSCCERCCYEENRKYELKLMHGDEVVARIKKPYHCAGFCCFYQSAKTESPEDNQIGRIRQTFSLFGHSKYAIYDEQQEASKPQFYVVPQSCKLCCTPCISTCLCSNDEFHIIQASDNEQVGVIARHWSAGDIDPDQFGTGTDVFGVYFLPNLEPRHKVLLLSACFMMNFLYFEKDRRRKKIGGC